MGKRGRNLSSKADRAYSPDPAFAGRIQAALTGETRPSLVADARSAPASSNDPHYMFANDMFAGDVLADVLSIKDSSTSLDSDVEFTDALLFRTLAPRLALLRWPIWDAHHAAQAC